MLAGALGSTGSVFWVLTFGTTSGSRCCVLFSSKLVAERSALQGLSCTAHTPPAGRFGVLFFGFQP